MERDFTKDFPVLHDFCKKCRGCRLAKKDGPINQDTKKPHYEEGDFIVPCVGIPADLNYVPGFDKIKHSLSNEEVDFSKALYDPILWAKQNLDWEPRISNDGDEFQAMPLRCTSKRKVFRFGRRLGKTELMCVGMLHHLFTNAPEVKRWDSKLKKYVAGFATILVLAPYINQIKLIFDRLNALINSNPNLSNEVKRNVASPYHCIELYNGAKIIGFPSGAKSGSGAESVRGQKADFIVLDEMDYLREQDLEMVVAMLMEHNDVVLWASSTPSGKREHFWKFCTERMDFKEFYAPSMKNPAWGAELELELRTFYSTEIAWQHEILAEFGDSATGVFQASFVDASQMSYKYDNQNYKNDLIYGIGVDWNDVANGTKLVVVGLDQSTGKFRVVAKESVQKAGWTQLSSINKLVELNRHWHPEFITVDEGYGMTQIELLKKIGMEAELAGNRVDAKLKEVYAINLSSKIELYDPLTQLPTKEWIKPYMVNNAVRRFEQGQMETSKFDDELYNQLLGYHIQKMTVTGMPVYLAGPAGDHELDAFMLCLLGFTKGMSEFTNQHFSGIMSISGKLGANSLGNELALAQAEKREPDFYGVRNSSQPIKPAQPEGHFPEKPVVEGVPALADGMKNTRIYSPEAFREDGRRSGFMQPVKRRLYQGHPTRKNF